MCTRRPTSAMPKPFLCCERAFCCSMVVMWPVLMHVMSFDVVVMSFDAMWLLVLCHVTWCNAMWCDVRSCDLMRCGCLCCAMSRDAMRCHVMRPHVMSCHLLCPGMECYELKVPLVVRSRCVFEVVLWRCGDPKYYSLLQSTTLYYTVIQRTTPVLLCTTTYYSVLQSTTPVLLCTTKYYSSTTLLQYYSVPQSTTPVLLCTTKYYSSTTLYYNVLLQYYSVLQSTTTYYRITYETSFTMRGATRVTLQLHQILRLPRKMNVISDPRHIWNVISNARRK